MNDVLIIVSHPTFMLSWGFGWAVTILSFIKIKELPHPRPLITAENQPNMSHLHWSKYPWTQNLIDNNLNRQHRWRDTCYKGT